MTRVVRDLRGVTHAFEAASWHNSRCGQRVETHVIGVPWTPVGGRDGAVLPEGVVDCMACLSGQSHLNVGDLHNGVEVRVWIQLDGLDGPVGTPQPITFTRGINIDEVVFDVPVGVVAYGYVFLDEDGRYLHRRVAAFPGGVLRRCEDDTIMIPAGKAQVR